MDDATIVNFVDLGDDDFTEKIEHLKATIRIMHGVDSDEYSTLTRLIHERMLNYRAFKEAQRTYTYLLDYHGLWREPEGEYRMPDPDGNGTVLIHRGKKERRTREAPRLASPRFSQPPRTRG